MTALTAVSLFAGIGGLDLALSRAGINVVAAVEIDPACRAVLARHFPNTALFPDIREVTGDQLRATGFDPGNGVLAGGWPCQDLSMAGRRAGLGGARSGLFWHFMRLADRLRPRWIVAENVPGLLSAVCSCPGDGTCTRAGRAVRCGRYDTRDRQRVWLPGAAHTVPGGACPGGCMPAHGGGMGTVLGALGQRGYGFAYRVLDAQFFGVPQRRERVFIAGCLGDRAGPVQVLLEPEGSCGHPAPRRSPGPEVAGAPGSCTSRGRLTTPAGQGTKVAGTLGGGSGQRGWCDDYERMTFLPVVAHALDAHAGRQRCDAAWVTHPLTAEGADATEDGGGRGTPLVPVAASLTSGTAADRARPTGRRREDDANLIGAAAGVRRLTPRECERLQGFPDNWTRWLADGREQADSARYRQLGNAVAVPVAEWIARRLATAHHADAGLDTGEGVAA